MIKTDPCWGIADKGHCMMMCDVYFFSFPDDSFQNQKPWSDKTITLQSRTSSKKKHGIVMSSVESCRRVFALGFQSLMTVTK